MVTYPSDEVRDACDIIGVAFHSGDRLALVAIEWLASKETLKIVRVGELWSISGHDWTTADPNLFDGLVRAVRIKAIQDKAKFEQDGPKTTHEPTVSA